jgi:hypothetical protein
MSQLTVTLMDTRPVILVTALEKATIARDWPESEREIRQRLDTHPEPLFVIYDLRQVDMPLGDIVSAASLGTRGDHALWRHPRLRGLVFITTSDLVIKGIEGLHSSTFGGVRARSFDTLDEAFADIDRILANEP